jgi:Reverse transcriptase (RNA-dependent DNA polymerase)
LTLKQHFDLDEDIYVQAPKGSNIKPNECVKLDKALYGLVQAAHQFYIKFAKVLVDVGFTASYDDPCLIHQNNQSGKIVKLTTTTNKQSTGNGGNSGSGSKVTTCNKQY